MFTLPGFLSWNWSPNLIIAAIFLFGGYIWISRFNNLRKTFLFVSGLAVAVIALAIPLGPSPKGFIANALSCCLPGGTLFSLHMLRHILLLMVAPPLLVSGLPKEPLKKILSKPHIKPWAKRFSSPYLGWIAGVGAMWFWHVPPIYNYMTTYGTSLGHLVMPEIEIISLLVAGALLSWPILAPLKEYRMHPLKGSLYLFLACTACSALGMSIAFASTGYFYTAFASQPGPIWGVSQKADQIIGGLLMWIPGCIIYVTGVMVLVGRWAYESDRAQGLRGSTSVNKKRVDDQSSLPGIHKPTQMPPAQLPRVPGHETAAIHH